MKSKGGREMKESFVISYLKGILTPTKMVEAKDKFSWPKLVVILLFLLAITLTPFSFHTQNQAQQLKNVMPHAFELVNTKVAQKVSHLSIKNNTKIGETFKIKRHQGVVMSVNQKQWDALPLHSTGSTDYTLKGYKNAIIFGPKQLVVIDQVGQGVSMLYPTSKVHMSPKVSSVQQFITQNWFNNHRLTMQMMYLMMETTIVLALFLLIILGATLIMFFALRRKISQVTLKELVAVVLLSAGIPTILCACLGGIIKDPMFGLQIQTSIWVLYLVFVFWKMVAPQINLGHELRHTLLKGEG